MAQSAPQFEKTRWPMVEAHPVDLGWQVKWQIRVGAAPNTRVVFSQIEPTAWPDYGSALAAGGDAVRRWLQTNGAEEK